MFLARSDSGCTFAQGKVYVTGIVTHSPNCVCEFTYEFIPPTVA